MEDIFNKILDIPKLERVARDFHRSKGRRLELLNKIKE